jgi:alkanesulfonate monooxygenase SsuD/methylene tetrahydromethanopterin reductase-like flavin-dependent oxidoreductase (luciferase family)
MTNEQRDERRLEFGLFDILQVDPSRPTAELLRERLSHHREADRLGLDYVMLAERHFMPLYRAASPGLLLAALAESTERVRLGVLAYTLALHHPVLLAEEISTLDHLSGGRLEVGLGLGHRPQEIAGLGYPAEHRQAIFLENLMIMRQAWEGKQFKFDGALHHVDDIYVDPPLQRPHPPLWYAGGDPQITGWAARNGLSLAIGFQPDEGLVASTEAYLNETPPEGAPRQRVALMRHIYVAESSEQAREEIVTDLIRLGESLVANPHGLSNMPEQPPTREEAEAQYEDQKTRQIVVSGDPAEVADAIATSLRTLRANTFLANIHLTLVEDARIRRTLRLYAEQVVPLVRERLAIE